MGFDRLSPHNRLFSGAEGIKTAEQRPGTAMPGRSPFELRRSPSPAHELVSRGRDAAGGTVVPATCPGNMLD
jgi:hypothetical protein